VWCGLSWNRSAGWCPIQGILARLPAVGTLIGTVKLDPLMVKLARGEPSGRSKLLYEGSTGGIAPRGEGLITRSPVLIGRQAMTAELEMVGDRAMG
jgi:hypothetical protein